MKCHIILDADGPLYTAAYHGEMVIDWGDGIVTASNNLSESLEHFSGQISRVMDVVYGEFPEVETCIVHYCFSLKDANGKYTRNYHYPDYKANRSSSRPPIGLKQLRDIVVRPLVYQLDGWEADDLVGALTYQYSNSKKPEEFCVVVSADKDLEQIPGYHINAAHPENGAYLVHEEDAERWRWKQVLMGDATDGYPGIFGVGPKKADKILSDPNLGDTLEQRVMAAYLNAGIPEQFEVMNKLATIYYGEYPNV